MFPGPNEAIEDSGNEPEKTQFSIAYFTTLRPLMAKSTVFSWKTQERTVIEEPFAERTAHATSSLEGSRI
jgi:hypothetical protein